MAITIDLPQIIQTRFGKNEKKKNLIHSGECVSVRLNWNATNKQIRKYPIR
jgi:hypothetical protein